MEIYLVNGKSVTVSFQSFDRTDEVLEVRRWPQSRGRVTLSLLIWQKAAVKIELDASLTYYFSLYLEEQTGDKWTCE